MNVGLENSLETHNALLFLITKETHLLGKLLKENFQCDFLLIKVEVPYDRVKSDQIDLGLNPEMKYDLAEMEAIAHTRQAHLMNSSSVSSSSFDKEQLRSLKEEKLALDQEIQTLKEDVTFKMNELETANKSIADKERHNKQLQRDIQHRDAQLRNNKTKIQELLESLGMKETQLKNSEKEIDSLKNDLKKQDLRFEK